MYRIVDGASQFFELESKSGVLYVKKPLDRERLAATGQAFFIKILVRTMNLILIYLFIFIIIHYLFI